MTTADSLRALPYFADLHPELLERVAAGSESLQLSPGHVIIEEGTDSEEMYVVVTGELVVTKRGSTDNEVTLARIGPGEVVGEIAMLDQAPRTATVTTTIASDVIRVPALAFSELLSDAKVVRRMFRTVTSRLRGIEDTLRHEERMSALGKMAAQLMHELNNPAAAVGRSTSELERIYSELNEEAVSLADAIGNGVRFLSPLPPGDMSPLELADKEDELAGVLDDLEVPDAWELAPAMVAAGWQPNLIREIADGVDPELRPHLVRWIALRATAGQLIGEIRVAAGRVSELVRIVKEYSYLDQAPIQAVSIAEGIKDTLVLLKHKLRGIEVVTEFASDLPVIELPGRDLNQVWTNLIDNAADVMEEGDTLRITTAVAGDKVSVSVSDTGGGIDDETAERIFDPFFTTKEPGKGTGLGLHTVHTIITRIGGDITVDSSKEGTTFTVLLPVGLGLES
ncbi:MAG: ATP-binding protein [Acidimicrobiia bacterium]